MTLDPLQRLGARIASEQDARLESTKPDAVLRQVVARHAARRSATPLPARARWLGMASWLAPVLLVLGVWLGHGWWSGRTTEAAPSLTFRVDERDGVLHAWESASSDRAVVLEFSDGTSFRLAPETRARVAALDDRGAEVVLESGEAHVHVVAQQDAPAHYLVRTGPFVVEIKGTLFDVRWDAAAEEFSLRLYEGRVNVTGCAFGTGREVPAGYWVRASCRRPGLELRALAEDGGSDDTPPVAPTLTPAPEPTLVPAIASAPTSPSPRPRAAQPTRTSWQHWARDGHFQRAYELARQSGFEFQCAQADVEDVILLGDAARHAGDSRRAREAYRSVRERAPGTTAAASAAFALGRLTLDGNPVEAGEWFEKCLVESPRGTLAQAARDRLLEAAVQQGEPRRLRDVADRYLSQSPKGPHAEQARAILRRAGSQP